MAEDKLKRIEFLLPKYLSGHIDFQSLGMYAILTLNLKIECNFDELIEAWKKVNAENDLKIGPDFLDVIKHIENQKQARLDELSKITYLDVAEEAEKLASLLRDPETGCFTWHEAVNDRVKSLSEKLNVIENH